ncbi:MAG TPA: YihY/virulence factor BrkB family protein [Fimbriiglobus sp.]|jgi:membrane protein|nr:YihY/virulence factor BrkB family protein [Fimbriiglobus sp.]
MPTTDTPAVKSDTTPLGRVRDLFGMLVEAGTEWQKDNAMRLSAAVAMYTILSLAPLLVISIKVVAVVLSEQAATRQVERQVQAFLGPKGAAAVNDMVAAASQPGSGALATLVSLGILLFTASGVFAELRDSLNAIWGVAADSGAGVWAAVRERLLSIGMVFVIGFLLLVSQFVTVTLTVLSEYVLGEAGWAAVVTDLFASTLVITLLFAVLFRFLPDVRLEWRDVLLGSAVTAVLFKLGQYLLSLYFTYISTGSAYGAAGSFVVVLLWVYYSGWILFYGAELIQVRIRHQGREVVPDAHAEKVNRSEAERSNPLQPTNQENQRQGRD